MSHLSRALVIGAILLSVAACSGGGAGGGTTPAGRELAETAAPPTVVPGGEAGPGEIIIEGDFNTRFSPESLVAHSMVDEVAIGLFTADQLTGVTLFMPMEIQPGTYRIGDLFNATDADITGRFDTFQDDATVSFESLNGALELTQTGSSFSGSFTFSAVRTPGGDLSVTIDGNFEAIPFGG
ncbi:MAG TPA: hypothetical protein VFI11_15715 [Anaerolineales bacterium]|nr:hypothetical protein [Anaerolineales bacterium]